MKEKYITHDDTAYKNEVKIQRLVRPTTQFFPIYFSNSYDKDTFIINTTEVFFFYIWRKNVR